MSYGVLDRRANQLARHLRALGAGPDALVAICMERSIAFVLAILGVLKAGAAYLPLDPSYPAERLRFMLEDSRAHILVTNDERAPTKESADHTFVLRPSSIVNLSSAWPAIAVQPADDLKVALGLANLAYAIYTSGSTGAPKGALIGHGSLAGYAQALGDALALGPNDGCLHTASFAFSSSVRQWALPLAHGATLTIASAEQISDPAALFELIERRGVTIIDLVPSYWRACLRALAAPGQQPPATLARLRLVLSASEPLPPATPRDWRARFGGSAALVNMFGQTETAGIVAIYRIPDDPDQRAPITPIGRALAGPIYLLDRAMQPVPIGAPGEVYIGGAQLARGYLGRPDLTADRFVPNPFVKGSGVGGRGSDSDPRSPIPDPRIYRTGDLARYRPDGSITLLGRVDQQVKVRGFRVEPSEVEALLARHPAVREALVAVRADASGDRRLVAYVVQGSGVSGQGSADPASESLTPDPRSLIPGLRAHLAATLPAYMLPSAFVFLDRWPLTPNGKIDRRALPAPDQARPASDGFAAPRTPVEAALAAIWADVLELDQAGVHDNFFALGGDSIRSIQIVARARATGLRMSPRHLFLHQTIAELAAAVEQIAPPPAPPPDRRETTAHALSPLQAGMLFHTLYAPGSGIYCEQFDWELRGDLDADAFARAWQTMAERHSALRTSFHWQDQAAPRQVAHAQADLPVARHDWRALSAAEQRARLRAYLMADRRQGFDLGAPPLLRLALLRLADDRHRFILTHHHLALDGWSLFVLFQEVVACYTALRAGQPIRLDPTRPYGDYIEWLERQPRAEAEAFWRRALAGFADPTPLVDGQGGAEGYAERGIELAAATTGALEALARAQRLTLNTIAQGSWALLLARYSGQRDVLFGATVAGRPAELPGVERMVGLFINTLPVRVAVPPNAALADWLRALQAQQAELRQYEHSALIDIQGWSEIPRGQPLFESIVVFENYPIDRSLRAWSADIAIQPGRSFHRTNYPLTFVALPGPDLALRIAYDERRFDAATVARALGHLRTLLEAMIEAPARRLADLPLLAAAERRQILEAWNDTAAAYPPDRCLHQLFEAQAARTPGAVALVFDEGRRTKDESEPSSMVVRPSSITYAELNERANQLAHHLRALGVGPESLVALRLDRSVELAVALLGVLKAGSAYLALDPALPAARIDFMLQDSGARVLVTKDQGPKTMDETPSFCPWFLVDLTEDWPQIAKRPATNPIGGSAPDHLAYAIYTSGSTGSPKGVLMSHRAVANRLAWAQATFPLTEIDRVLQKYSFGFDPAICEFFWPLANGARVVMARPGGQMDAAYLVELIAAQRVTVIDLVPAMLQMLLDQPGIANCNCLRHVFCGGDPLPPDLRARFFARLDGALSNHYGPTEAAIDVAAWMCRPDDPPRAVPIGRPIANTQIYLLDRAMQPVPIGAPGEIYIGGSQLARGYLGRPDLTADRFVPNPFAKGSGVWGLGSDSDPRSPIPDPRLYRTGDLARFQPDGSLEFLGRADRQVKLRGFRVELGEVEAALARQPGLRESAVLAREDAPGDARLVAYVVPQRGAQAEWWPSVGEYQVYDELLYYAMTNDELRAQRYRAAIGRAVAGKVVADIGAGADAILARMCAEAGARRVYAIEILDDAYRQALERVRSLGLEHTITVIHGDVFTVELPEPVDVCVSELIGAIGGSEGAAPLLDAARRFLKPGGAMLPQRSVTRIAAVQIPDGLAGAGFAPVPASYAEKVFERIGYRFDLRMCVKGLPPESLISGAATFEDLDFTRPRPADDVREIELRIDRDARLDGFLLWVRLHVDGDATIDTLEQQTHWLPAYFPAFYPGVAVRAGDRISATCASRPGANGLNPDYSIAGRLTRGDGEVVAFAYDSFHHRRAAPHPFYAALFDAPRPAPELSIPQLRARLAAQLPEHMLPSAFVALDALPRLPSGKLDQRALTAPDRQRPEQAAAYAAPRGQIERAITAIWQETLGIERVGVHDNFFDLGGHSLLMVQAHGRLREALGRDLSLVDLFRYPTISALAEYLSPGHADAPVPRSPAAPLAPGSPDIAIIGMSGRFPRARNIDVFWRNLCNGVEAVSSFSEADLAESGADPAILTNDRYVNAKAFLEDVEWFDAAFFGYSPREAEAIDPQQRVFLECAWEALERAGYDSARYDGRIGVFGGASANSYLLFNLYANRELIDALGGFQLALGNDKDYLTTRVSYKLNLSGPSLDVQTACSTALVATALACQSLAQRQCDLALAGGVSISVPLKAGYLYQDGGVRSPDGHCRAFDALARGTVGGDGAGVVALKRLDDALADGDAICAVIKGWAINNDGARKVGFTAPSVAGQAAVIAEALAMAGVDPATIGYVEAHGTGTPLGDPIEVAALNQAFQGAARPGTCAIGSVKTNIGHLDAAAGIAGLIKAALALQHARIPPSLNFAAPNPQIDFASGPFYVNAELREWPAGDQPRRAGVSSFGIGGTNAHIVLEEAPPPRESAPARPWQILPMSARTATALDAATANLAAHLRENPSANLADLAHTLQNGRRAFPWRRALVVRDTSDALAALEARDPQRLLTSGPARDDRPVAFLFPGQGAQYPGMARELYDAEPGFRAEVDRCCELLRPQLGLDLRELLYPPEGSGIRDQGSGSEGKETRRYGDKQNPSAGLSAPRPPTPDPRSPALDQTQYAQPALFVIEYALAQLWMSWGIRPAALIGHSVGEYVAACLAGVFSLEDALALVAARGRMMQQMPPGAMLSVALGEAELRSLIEAGLDLAAINAPGMCTVAGPRDAIEALRARLRALGVECRDLRTSHAFHSAMIDPVVAPFAELVGRVALRPPSIPFVSNVTGTWIRADEATDPAYWARHLRSTVRFADGAGALLREGDPILLELGPGRALSTLARQHPAWSEQSLALAALPGSRERRPARAAALETLGRLWIGGARVGWEGIHDGARRRVPLPTYPFERQRYWIEPRGAPASQHAPAAPDAPDAPPSAPLDQHPRPQLPTAFAAPESEIERSIAAIWQELLGVAPIGLHDDFFALGGHSLLATQIVARLQELFPVELPVQQLFEAATIAQLAELIEDLLIAHIESLTDDDVQRLSDESLAASQ